MAKLAQEELIRTGPIPYSIVRATQFFEFVKSIADAFTRGNTVRLSPALIQPIAADDVAAAIAGVAVQPPANRVLEFAGPEQFRLPDLVRRQLRARSDLRNVVVDPLSRYFGTDLEERVTDWLSRQGSRFSVADAFVLGGLLVATILFALTRLP